LHCLTDVGLMASQRAILGTRSWAILLQLQTSLARICHALRKFCFSVICFSIVLSKLLHIWAHLDSVPPAKLCLWSPTFFGQDLLLIYILRICVQPVDLKSWQILDVLGTTLAILTSLVVLFMASSNISFYFFTGAEIHWRLLSKFHHDSAGFKTFLYGLTGFLISAGVILLVSWLLASFVYDFWGNVVGVFSWIMQKIWGNAIRPVVGRMRKSGSSSSHTDSDDEEHLLKDLGPPGSPTTKESVDTVDGVARPGKLYCTLVLVVTVALIIMRAVRPHDYAYSFLSWVLPLSPFVGGSRCFESVELGGMPGRDGWLKGRTSLDVPPHWDFLPQDSMPGFEDWYSCRGICKRKLHYSPGKDPLHIDNLGDPILDTLRKAFDQDEVSIKHIFFIKLESTRSDVFPVREGGHMFNTVEESYDHKIPKEIQERFAKLTPTAEWLTGMSGPFSDNTSAASPRGGLVATDAFTTGTYTLKSLPGSLCGITPLVADFNREYNHHIYQPCLPHIFNMLNAVANETQQAQTDDYLTWPWESRYMQSVTDTYDNQAPLTPKMGFHDWITKETLEDPEKWKHPPTTKPVCLYGYPDEELRESIHDAIEDAETNHKRLFLTHLTGTTHEPWSLPKPWDRNRELVGHTDGALKIVQRYLNAIGYDDQWMKTIFDMLEETGIANQTLVVLAGDHGVSVPEGAITPYDDYKVGAFHVPFVFSHASLPPITISAP
ncbi:MAG: hypothetical protein Q9174_006027, partial [Haloplaca sp. 1 TL-2023]